MACGEVGLGGELRQVARTPRRLAEAARLGFRHAVVPRRHPSVAGLGLIEVGIVLEAAAAVGLLSDSDGPDRGSLRQVPDCAIGHRGNIPPWHRPATPAARRARSGRARAQPCARASTASCQARMGALIVVATARGAEHLLGRVPARRRLQPPAPVGAGQDGRRHHPGPRRQPHRPGQRAPGAQPERAHLRDRHPPPHRRAGGPLDRRAGDLGVRGHAVIAVYVGRRRSTALEPIPRLLDRANQALQTLERYKNRLDEVSQRLSALEVEDLVTVRDVVSVLQRTEMVRRIAEEIEGYIVELGVDGRLVRLQLEELMGGVEDDRRLVLHDYFHEDADWHLDEAMAALAELDTDDLLDLKAVAAVLHLPRTPPTSTPACSPGATACWPRSPACPRRSSTTSSSASAPCRRSCGPPSTTSTTSTGVGETRARAIKEGLPAWPRPASSTATAEPDRLATAWQLSGRVAAICSRLVIAVAAVDLLDPAQADERWRWPC